MRNYYYETDISDWQIILIHVQIIGWQNEDPIESIELQKKKPCLAFFLKNIW